MNIFQQYTDQRLKMTADATCQCQMSRLGLAGPGSEEKRQFWRRGRQELSQMNNYHSAVGTFSLTSRLLLLSGLSSLNRGQLSVASPLVLGTSSCFSVHSNKAYLHCVPVFLQSVTDATSICLKVLLLQPLTKSAQFHRKSTTMSK